MGLVRCLVLIAYVVADITIPIVAVLLFQPAFDVNTALAKLDPNLYTFSKGVLDLVALSVIRLTILLGVFFLQKCGIFSPGPKCRRLVIVMGIFLYAFATGKLLAVAEKEDQEVAMWILVCWNLAASMLHPIVFSISIKPVDKIGKSGQEKDSSEASGNSITDGDELSTGKISKILAIYALKSWPVLFTALFCLCGYAITRIFVPIYIGRVIHTVAESGKMGDITPTVITLSGIAFTSLLFGGIRGCMFTTLTGLISRDVRRDLFRSLIRQEIAFYDKKPTGDLISRLSSDTSTVINTLTTNLNVCSRNGIMIIGSLIAMLGISWKLTVTCFVTAPAFAIINKYFGRYFDKMAEKTQNALAETTKKAEEVLSQIRTVRSFANEENEAIKYERALEIVVQLNYKRAFAYLFNVWTNEAYQYISLIVVLFYGSYLVIEKQMTAGQLITYFLYQTSLAEYVYGFGTYYVEMMATLGASRNIMQLMFRKPAIDQSAGNLTPEVIGNIELKNVHFTYPSRRNNPILNDVSLEINKGETVALVGPSGGGKSSIVSLIERFYKPLMGNIYLDGTPINQFEHRYYHRKICLVSQEPQLFSGTIRENIAYGLDECSDEKIIEAAKIANAYDFIMKLEKRFDTECGERGVQLSGGQKQRIAISRAVVRDPAVLILDEATSALDTESEALVQEAMNRCAKDRTVIVIAHRLSTIKSAQKIAVIEKGRIIQIGNHETLMADRSGLYHSLVAKQIATAERGESPSEETRVRAESAP